MTGPVDTSTKPSKFFLLLVLQKRCITSDYGQQNFLPQFQKGTRHFSWDQQLRLEKPGWRALAFQCNQPTERAWASEEEKSGRTFSCARSGTSFHWDLTAGKPGVGDPNLTARVKVSSFVDIFQMRDSLELFETLWSQFVTAAALMDSAVEWIQDEIARSSVNNPEF